MHKDAGPWPNTEIAISACPGNQTVSLKQGVLCRFPTESEAQSDPMKGFGSVLAALCLLLCGVVAAPSSLAAQQWEVLDGLDDDVEDIVFGPDGTLYAGGYFTGYVASWDGTSWTPLSGLDDNVSTLAVDSNGTLFAAGAFTGKVAEWNGSGWDTSLGTFPANLDPEALVVRSGILFAAGSAPNAPYVASWDGTSWSPLTAGSGPTESVGAVVSGPNGVVAGSDDGNVYEFSSGSWSQIGGGLDIGSIYSLAYGSDGTLYAGGQENGMVSAYDTTSATWSAISPTLSETDPSTSNRLYGLLGASDGSLWVGGFFDVDSEGSTYEWLVRRSGNSWTSPGSDFFTWRIRDFAEGPSGTIYAAGGFDGGVARWVDVPVSVDPTQLPPDIMQQVGRLGQSCDEVDDGELNWGGAGAGGWNPSWADWAVPVTGGPVCVRSLYYNPYTMRWAVR